MLPAGASRTAAGSGDDPAASLLGMTITGFIVGGVIYGVRKYRDKLARRMRDSLANEQRGGEGA